MQPVNVCVGVLEVCQLLIKTDHRERLILLCHCHGVCIHLESIIFYLMPVFLCVVARLCDNVGVTKERCNSPPPWVIHY